MRRQVFPIGYSYVAYKHPKRGKLVWLTYELKEDALNAPNEYIHPKDGSIYYKYGVSVSTV